VVSADVFSSSFPVGLNLRLLWAAGHTAPAPSPFPLQLISDVRGPDRTVMSNNKKINSADTISRSGYAVSPLQLAIFLFYFCGERLTLIRPILLETRLDLSDIPVVKTVRALQIQSCKSGFDRCQIRRSIAAMQRLTFSFPFSKKAGADETHVRMIKPVIARCGMAGADTRTVTTGYGNQTSSALSVCLIGHSIAYLGQVVLRG
jgi:hypothetical protein